MKISMYLKRLVPRFLLTRFKLGCSRCGVWDSAFSADYEYHDPETNISNMYCVDCWPGYDHCATIGCGHYRCEHSTGETWTTVYTNPDQFPGSSGLGEEFFVRPGCMNYGCVCDEFKTQVDIEQSLANLGYARSNAHYLLSEIEGVGGVRSKVTFSVDIETNVNIFSYETLEALKKLQEIIKADYPSVTFNFKTTYGISEHE